MNTRRLVLARLSGLAWCGPAGVAFAQSSSKPVRLAYVWLFSSGPSAPYHEAFRVRLRELGWHEGRDYTLTHHDADGDPKRLSAIMEALVRDKIDLIVATCTPEAKAARALTSSIPIVMTSTGDPVVAGLVQSMSRPGGNVTGVSTMSLPLSARRVALLKEAFPKLAQVTVLWNPERPDNHAELTTMQEAAAKLGMRLRSAQVRSRHELESELEAIAWDGTQSLMNAGDNLVNSRLQRIVDQAARLKLPALYEDRVFVEAGGLMSYGPNLRKLHARAADYVDKVLKGAKPGDLPIEQPTRFELVINRGVARAQGLALPGSVMLQADQVIE